MIGMCYSHLRVVREAIFHVGGLFCQRTGYTCGELDT